MTVESNGNVPAWTGPTAGRRGHVESWFVALHRPDGTQAVWLRWTLFAPPRGPARVESWSVFFHRGRPPRAFKHSQPSTANNVIQSPFALEFPLARFDGIRTRGDHGGLAWDFTLEPSSASPLRVLPYAWMYRTMLPETKLVTPVPDAQARGTLAVDGVSIDVTGWRAMQGHNWGTRHARRYAWCHATGFEQGADGESVVFEACASRIQRPAGELPWITYAFLWIDGAWMRFDRARDVPRGRSDVSVMRWAFDAVHGGHTLRGRVHAPSAGTVGLHYANPTGPTTYCLNASLATLELELIGPDRSRTFVTHKAAFELGWPTADHGIIMAA